MTLGRDFSNAGPATMLLVGFVLFVIPEPASSALGAGLLLLGSVWWFYRWGRS